MLVDFGYVTQSRDELEILTKAAKHIRHEIPNQWVYPKNSDEADYASFFRALKQGSYRAGFSTQGAPTDLFTDAPRTIDARCAGCSRQVCGKPAPQKPPELHPWVTRLMLDTNDLYIVPSGICTVRTFVQSIQASGIRFLATTKYCVNISGHRVVS
jgi:hypothetical protein